MKKQSCILMAAAILFALTSCSKKDNDELAHHHDHEHEEAHHHDHDEDDTHEEGEDVISLKPEVAARFGLKTAVAENRNFNAVVKASAMVEPSVEGTAVVTAPTSGIATLAPNIEIGTTVKAGQVVASISAAGLTGGDANRLAKVELDAAQSEYERLKALYADRLVTQSQYNEAKAAYERARAVYSSSAAGGKATAPISGVITSLNITAGQYVETGQAIANIGTSERLILRADVPVKSYPSVSNAQDARIIKGDHSAILVSSLGGRRIGTNSPAVSQGGYVPVSFTLENNGDLIPGQPLEIYIIGPTDHDGIAVPVGALAEKQGRFFVYEQIDEDCYRQIPVEVGMSDGEYVEIINGLNGGENIVVEGTTAVKLAQTSGAVPEGHTHSH